MTCVGRGYTPELKSDDDLKDSQVLRIHMSLSDVKIPLHFGWST
jgi:hypothetical protein